MKKFVLILSLFLAFGLNLSTEAVTVVEKDMGFVSVNANATKEIVPDTASIRFTIETVSKDSKDVVNKNKELSTALITALKPLLELDKSDMIQTNSFVLRPNYTTDKSGKKNFVDYTARNIVFVKTKNIDKMAELIDVATKNNVTSVDDLNFYVENQKQFEGQLAKEALSNAQIIADLTASTLGQKVTGIRAVRVNIYPQNSNTAVYRSVKSAASSATTLPLEYGKIKIQAHVDAEFYVK